MRVLVEDLVGAAVGVVMCTLLLGFVLYGIWFLLVTGWHAFGFWP
jgi:hypothetical protein